MKEYEGTNKFPVKSPKGIVDKFGEPYTIWVSPGQRINWTKEIRRIKLREQQFSDEPVSSR